MAAPRKPSKGQLDAAVRTAQLYAGALSCTAIRDQQRLYQRMMGQFQRIAATSGMSVEDVSDQITARARSLGPICPRPGRDI